MSTYILRADDARNDSEETSPSLYVKLAITREQSYSLHTHESKSKKTYVALSLQKLLVFVTLQPLSSYSWNTLTHTHNQLYRIPRTTMPQGIITHTVHIVKQNSLVGMCI